MRAAIAAAKRPANVLSAQDSIPFERMFPDGICRVEGKFYSKTIQFQDINYQLSQSEDKDAIFDGWCDFLNYFDASVRFQFSFVNSAANKETYRDRITIPLRGDEDDSLRAEYSRMLQDQLERGNNGLIKNKYLMLYRCNGRLVPYADRRFRGMFAVKERRTMVTPLGKQVLHDFIGMLTSDEKAAV